MCINTIPLTNCFKMSSRWDGEGKFFPGVVAGHNAAQDTYRVCLMPRLQMHARSVLLPAGIPFRGHSGRILCTQQEM